MTLQEAKAKELVESKTITISNVTIALYKKRAPAGPMPTDGLFQELETAAAEVSWSTYHASPRLKQELESIIDAKDDAKVQTLFTPRNPYYRVWSIRSRRPVIGPLAGERKLGTTGGRGRQSWRPLS